MGYRACDSDDERSFGWCVDVGRPDDFVKEYQGQLSKARTQQLRLTSEGHLAEHLPKGSLLQDHEKSTSKGTLSLKEALRPYEALLELPRETTTLRILVMDRRWNTFHVTHSRLSAAGRWENYEDALTYTEEGGWAKCERVPDRWQEIPTEWLTTNCGTESKAEEVSPSPTLALERDDPSTAALEAKTRQSEVGHETHNTVSEDLA
jgi:rubredoxin